MIRIFKILFKSLGIAILTILGLLIFVIALLQFPSAQNQVAKIAVNYLSKQAKINFSFKNFRLSHFNTLEIDSLLLTDRENNQLLDIGNVTAIIGHVNIAKTSFHLKKLSVSDVDFNHIKYLDHQKSNLIELFPPSKKKSKPSGNVVKIYCDYVEANNCDYIYKDYNKPETPLSINFKDLEVTEAYVKAMDIKVIGDSINLKVMLATLKEKTGFNPTIDYADLIVCKKSIEVTNVQASTKSSDFDIDLILHSYNYKSYGAFTDSVCIEGTIKENSIVDLADVAYFSSNLSGAGNIVRVKAQVYGIVNDLDIKNAILDLGNNTHFDGDIHIKDTEHKNISLDVNVVDFTTTAKDIEDINIPSFKKNVFAPYRLTLPKEIHKLGIMELSGNFKGKIYDFASKMNLKTQEGDVSVDISYLPDNNNYNNFNIYLNGLAVNVGEILDIEPKISTLDADFHLSGMADHFSPQSFSINGKMNNVKLENITLNDIAVAVQNTNDDFNAHINIYNENVFFQAYFSHFYNAIAPITNISISAEQTNLSKLGLFPLEENFTTSFFINSNIIGNDIDDINMQTYITDFSFANSTNAFSPIDFNIIQKYDNITKEKNISISSNPIQIDINGNFSYLDLPILIDNIKKSLLPSSAQDIKPLINDTCYLTADFNISKDNRLLNILAPGLSIDDSFHGNITMPDPNHFTFSINSKELKYNNFNIGIINLLSVFDSTILTADINIDSTKFASTSNLDDIVNITNSNWKFSICSDTAKANVLWLDTINHRNGGISLLSDLSELPTIKVLIPDSVYMSTPKGFWTIKNDGFLVYDSTSIVIDNIVLQGNDAGLVINGKYSTQSQDSLNAYFKNINLSLFKLFLPPSMDLTGIVEGNLVMTRNNDYPIIYSNLGVNDIVVNQTQFGDLTLNSSWDNTSNSLYLITNLIQNNSDTVIDIVGVYYPFNNNKVEGNFDIDSLDFALFNPFVNNFISNTFGSISGSVRLKNTIENPLFDGNINFSDAGFTINFTNTPYTFSNIISIKPESIILEDFRLYDSQNKFFNVSGRITHNNWKDFILDIKTNFDEFTVLDNQQKTKEIVYGHTVLSGSAELKGPLDDFDISADLNTNQGTEVTIAISSNKTASQMSFVNFTSNDTTTISKILKKKNDAFSIDANAKIDNSTKLNIILPYNIGNMSISGNGDISYIQEKNGNYDISGDYTVDKGVFQLNFQNVLRRNFSLRNGGTIIFNGDPMNASLDLQAVYEVRASLQGIPTIADQSVADQRVQVNCVIKFTGALYDPTITFDIELPNVNEDLQSVIFSAIDVNDQAALSQQIFSLLVLKSFSFTTESTLVGAGIGANSLSIISGQLSQWISMINQGFDMGVNYSPGDDLTPEEFEVYMKTQFFDDRLIIDGNFGVQNKNSVNTESNIIGDVQIEYKITEDGKLRVKAFNRTNQYSILENNDLYTQGVGLSYSTEFDKISELFKKKRKKR